MIFAKCVDDTIGLRKFVFITGAKGVLTDMKPFGLKISVQKGDVAILFFVLMRARYSFCRVAQNDPLAYVRRFYN